MSEFACDAQLVWRAASGRLCTLALTGRDEPVRIGADAHCEVALPEAAGAPALVLTPDGPSRSWQTALLEPWTANAPGTQPSVQLQPGSALSCSGKPLVLLAPQALQAALLMPRAVVPGLTLFRQVAAFSPTGVLVAVAPFGEGSTTALWSVTETGVRIGRLPNLECVRNGPTVSRHHCTALQTSTGFFATDNGSANGTEVDGARLEPGVPQMLRHGSLIKVGTDHQFRFLEADVGPAGHGGLDPATGFADRAQLLLWLAACDLAPELRACMSVAAFSVDQFASGLQQADPISSTVARTVARLLQECLPPWTLLARVGIGEFVAVLPVAAPDPAWLTTTVARVAAHSWQQDSARLWVTISAGLATQTWPGTTGAAGAQVSRLLPAARAAVEQAMQNGGNQALTAHGHDAPSVLAVVRPTGEPRGALVTAVLTSGLDALPAVDVDRRLAQLQSAIEGAVQGAGGAPPAQMRAQRRGAALILDLSVDRPGLAEAAMDAARARWSAFPVADRPAWRQALHLASMAGAEARALGRPALDELVRRALSGDTRQLPHPIAALVPLADHHATELAKAKTWCDAIEFAMRLLVAAFLGELSATGDPEVIAEAGGALRTLNLRQALSMGAWGQALLALAPIVARRPQTVIGHLAGKLLATQFQQVPLRQALDTAVAIRNKQLVHAATRNEATYAQPRAWLQGLFEQLRDELRPLSDLRMVAVADSSDDEDDATGRKYKLFVLQGADDKFAVLEGQTSTSRMRKGQCYLLDADGAALSLAPVYFVAPCDVCGRVELFVADGLGFGPGGGALKGQGLTTGHRATTRYPPGMERWAAAVAH